MGYNYNLICVVDPDSRYVLFCKRRKPPYKGLYNLVGGKIEPGEDGESAAYRELAEETGIAREDIDLRHMMTIEYPTELGRMEVWAGRLRHMVDVCGDENDLEWLSLEENFFDVTRFAGVGNVGHIIEYACFFPEIIAPDGAKRAAAPPF